MRQANPPVDVSIADAVLDAARALTQAPKRRLLGLAGPPAAGKSTAAAALVGALGGAAAHVPMDGFHLARRQLERLGRAQRKGAPDTFDVAGYQALLARLHRAYGTRETIYAPGFDRKLEEPIAAALAVAPETVLVITEGNYLLLDAEPWPHVAAQLDAVWYLDVDIARRERWLAARHRRFGLDAAAANAWIAATDRPNAQRIAPTAARANRVLRWNAERLEFVD